MSRRSRASAGVALSSNGSSQSHAREGNRDGADPVTPPATAGATLGVLTGWDALGWPLVAVPGRGAPLQARSTLPLQPDAVGREVALLPVPSDPDRPLIVGLLQPPGPQPAQPTNPSPLSAQVDGERITFTAGREIALRCGEASIVLTSDGRVLLEGRYILSRSRGINRIKGGSVQIN